MKCQILISSLLVGLLLGCAENQADNTMQATAIPVQLANEFDGVPFPQDSCGDKLPQDPQAYPVEFYPIFIDYSDSNLQLVQSKFCRDALTKYRKAMDKDFIQVASFISPQRANQFKELMVKELGSGEVGEFTMINLPTPSDTADSLKAPASITEKAPPSTAEAALLTPDQVKQLVVMDNNNFKGIEFKVIVPTYIPAGFQIEKIETADRAGKIGDPHYQITYRNSRNACFSIYASSGGWGSGPGGQQSFEVNSPALGKVLLGYTEFQRATRKPSISFDEAPIIKGKQGYSFNSPGDTNCEVINIQEAIKIANSFEYLNP